MNSHVIRPSEVRVCDSCKSEPSAAVRSDGSCFSCHRPTRPADAAERAAYRLYLETRENPARAEYAMRPLILADET